MNILNVFRFCSYYVKFSYPFIFLTGQLELFIKGQYQIAAEESAQDQDPLNKVIEDIEGEDGPMNGKLQSHDPSQNSPSLIFNILFMDQL